MMQESNGLKAEIDQAKVKVNTDTVQITIGEVGNMYNSNELNIIPDFQRLFRWSEDRKSNLVESILIGIPIPPVFVYEDKDGSWELIDGLQRISTVLEFMGILRDVDTGELKRSKLVEAKYLPSLMNVVWEKKSEDEVQLDKSLQLFFRRHRVDFQILKHPSDPKTKFDLFQRLNRGGAYANEQEVRTCSMVLADANFTRVLREMSNRTDVLKIFRITSDHQKSQRNLEYLVRLVVHTFEEFTPGSDVQEFLDYAILKVISEKDHSQVIEHLDWVIRTLYNFLGDDALVPPDERPAGIAARFSLRALEGIAVGISRNRDRLTPLTNLGQFLQDKVVGFWQQPEIPAMSSPGLRGTDRLRRTIPFGTHWFNPDA